MTITDLNPLDVATGDAALHLPTFTSSAADGGYDFDLVAFDLYRDIHKGIRSELFAVTSAAGSCNPSDPIDRVAVADHVVAVAGILESHAEHEDAAIDPVLRRCAPDLAERIEHDHHVLEARVSWLVELARDVTVAPDGDARRLSHLLYLELSGFTSAYLAHQLVEERVVMPALERAVGFEAVLQIHQAIVTAIPPDEMAKGIAMMLPVMNVDDRTEMLAGIRASAPPEAFAGVVGLARSVLPVPAVAELERRLDLA